MANRDIAPIQLSDVPGWYDAVAAIERQGRLDSTIILAGAIVVPTMPAIVDEALVLEAAKLIGSVCMRTVGPAVNALGGAS
jgi:hypothetical protein